MRHARKPAPMRFNIKLDDSIALEALITHRLLSLAKPRRQEWLRTLLIKGFCEECAAIRQLQHDCRDTGASAYVPRLQPEPSPAETPDRHASAMASAAKNASPVPSPATPLSITALKAVVG